MDRVWKYPEDLITTAMLADDAVTFAKMQNIATDRLIGRDTAGSGDPEEISLGASLEFSGAGSIQRAALTGDVTASANGNETTIANDAVSNAKLRNSGALSVIGRSANSAGDPADISATAATDAVLRESGSTVGFGTVATAGIANDAVTNAKLRDSAAVSVIGRSANSVGDPGDIAASADQQVLVRSSGALKFSTASIPTTLWNKDFIFNVPSVVDPNSGTLTTAVNPSISDATDYDGHVVLFNWPDGQKRAIAVAFVVPDILDVTADVTAELFFQLSGAPAASAKVEIEWTFRAVADNEVMLSGGTTRTGAVIQVVDAHASGDLVVARLSTIFTGGDLAVDDYVKLTVWRDAGAGNADDTYTGIVQIVALKLTGTRAKATL